jgi:enoyl-CoA hydratase/carnithine racemase
MPSELLTERSGSTLILTISDPGTRNTLSPQVYVAGTEALNNADGDDELSCVVLRGDGAHFCAGGDLKRLADTRLRGREAQAASVAAFHDFIEALRSFPKPVIAAVEGFAAGGGCSLVLACDLVVAAEDARFVMSYGRAGLSPDGGGTWHLARALPRALALQMMWLPEPMSARQWHTLGLVNAVTDSGHALAEALRWAERLEAMAPNSLSSVKELVNQAPQRGLHEQLAAEREAFVDNLFHPNGEEGLQAFFGKRRPRFR